jgi:hemoglobin/transferrin/lactoferrin receptor protein
MLQKTSYGQGSPFLRGFTGFRTLLMVDGVRLNNAVFREGPNQYWNTVDPWSVDRYEVVLGPASVLYGSDAVGGAVNALTLDSAGLAGAAGL